MVSPEYRAATGPLAVVTLAEDEKDRYLSKIFGYKKHQHFKGWFRQQDRGPIGVLLFPGLEWDWASFFFETSL